MATFVLVHGAWHGSWCWKRVRKALQAQGHDVFTPTLTGVGERSHLLSPQVNLETHILDVENLLRWEDLSDVILCGHSYGGCVVGGVADRVPERIRSLVYLDAFVLESGESLTHHLPEPARKQMRDDAQADRLAQTLEVPPAPPKLIGSPFPAPAYDYTPPSYYSSSSSGNGWKVGVPFGLIAVVLVRCAAFSALSIRDSRRTRRSPPNFYPPKREPWLTTPKSPATTTATTS